MKWSVTFAGISIVNLANVIESVESACFAGIASKTVPTVRYPDAGRVCEAPDQANRAKRPRCAGECVIFR